MHHNINLADVPVVELSEFDFVFEALIESGQGLALLRGLNEEEIRAIEDLIWEAFPSSGQTRLAIALRFRALLDVFGARRLKALFLERGFRLFAAVAQEAAKHPLNVRFGFNSQRFLLALDARAASPEVAEPEALSIAA